MNSNKPSEDEILENALQLSGDARAAYLKTASCGDEFLRQRIEALIESHEAADQGEFLDQPPAGSMKTFLVNTGMVQVTEKAGDRIGRYKLLQQIGEGGCGVVYVAEQETPVRRRVALKLIKLGMDTKQVVARFEAERQALALMEHPNIAKVLDAGATETGRPFFVMELVKGIPVTQYCDENKLNTRQRLDLFVQICQAVQHAHQKGVIHRDIKPSNVLVADHDGVPVSKVIDFGIAKATTDQPLTDKTVFTALEQFIGTPAYMSPEQTKLSGLDIDTRSDIYSLGVLLYELLTGRTPFDSKELLAAGLEEMRRTIREKEPLRPSTRLSTMAADAQTMAATRRQTDAPRLIHLLRGDLDWVVMKCLEKDRNHRYETASGLAADIMHHLNNEPVVARPPNSFYRFQKLVRRNKLAFAAGSTVATALILGLGFSTWMFFSEKEAEREQAKEHELKSLTQQLVMTRLKPHTSGWSDVAWKLASQTAALRHNGNESDLRDQAVAVLAGLDAHQMGLITNRETSYQSNANLIVFSTDRTMTVGVETNGSITVKSTKDGHVLAVVTTGRCAVRSLALKQIDRIGNSNEVKSFGIAGAWLIAAGDEGGNVTIWDLCSQTVKSFCRGGNYDVNAVAFNPDGTLLASGGNGPARIWNVATGQELLELLTGYGIQSLRFSPDGKRLFVGKDATDGQMCEQVWELDYGRGIQSLRGLSATISKVCFSSDGKKLAALSHSWELGVWDLASGQLTRVIEAPKGYLADNAAIAFGPNGDRLAFSSGNDAKVWDIQSGHELNSWVLPPGLVDVMAFPEDNRLLLFRVETQDGNSVCRLRDLLGLGVDKPIAENRDFNLHVFAATTPPNGSFFVVEGLSKNGEQTNRIIKCLAGSNGKELWAIPSTSQSDSPPLAADVSGKFLALQTNLSQATNGHSTLVELSSGSPIKLLPWIPCVLGLGDEHYALVQSHGLVLFKEPKVYSPLVALGIDSGDSFAHQVDQFDASGNQLAWGNTDGTVTVCNLQDINQHLATAHLEW